MAEHCYHLLKGEPGLPEACVGGSHSEGQWRSAFRAGGVVRGLPAFPQGHKVSGLPMREPDIKEVEVGIDRVYGAHKRGELFVFSDLSRYLEEKQTYSRELDDAGAPTEEIADKEAYHLMDAERHVVGWLVRGRKRPRNSRDPYGRLTAEKRPRWDKWTKWRSFELT
jgi:hypothetical protein